MNREIGQGQVQGGGQCGGRVQGGVEVEDDSVD